MEVPPLPMQPQRLLHLRTAMAHLFSKGMLSPPTQQPLSVAHMEPPLEALPPTNRVAFFSTARL